MADRHQIQPYPIRMPEQLRKALEEAAKEGNRSLHAEIISRLNLPVEKTSFVLNDIDTGVLIEELLRRFPLDQISIRIGKDC